MAAMQQRPLQMGMQPPPPSPGHAQGHPQGPHGPMGQPMAGQMAQAQGQNPAMKIPYPLLPHVHLKSHQPYPISRQLNLPAIIQYLKEAPRVVNQLQPVEWTYLEPPRDGTIMLVWQAPGQVQFASDGHWWCDVETQQTQQVGNYNLEIFSQRIGYVPGESIATHTRTRYRLTPNGPPQQAPCDPCLWIVRWFRADQSQHLPVSRFPQNTPMAGVMQQRAQIEKAGRLVRKPFMLTDVANWPTLQVPESLMRPRGNSQAMEDLHAAKRQRNEDGKDDDEVLETIEVNPPPGEDDDKDLYDLLTPRDVSIHRYTRHNEWIEELFASPYALSAIKSASLGLGRSGPLRKLTKAFYQPALDERLIRQPEKFSGDDIARAYSTEEVDELEKQIQTYLAKDKSETAALTQRHEAALAQLRDKSLFMDAEMRLRHAVADPAASDPLDIESGSHFHYTSVRRRPEKIDDIVAEVSTKLDGQVPQGAPTFRCVAQGGYQTPPPPPSPPAEEDDEEEDEEMGEDDDEGQFVDFAANEGNGGLSAQPHPDAARGTGASAGNTDGAADGANESSAAAEGATAAGGEGAAPSASAGNGTDPSDDMVDFEAGDGGDDDDEEENDGGDFGASLDFGDLPGGDEGEESGAGGSGARPGGSSGAASGAGDQGAGTSAPEASGAQLGTAQPATSSAAISPAAEARAPSGTPQPVPTPPNAPAAAGETAKDGDAAGIVGTGTGADDVAMGEGGGTSDEPAGSDAETAGVGDKAASGAPEESRAEAGGAAAGDEAAGGETHGGDEGDGEAMDFEDSAFGDAFHHSEFES